MRCMDNDANKGILEYCIDGFWDENTDTCPSSCDAESLFCGSCTNTTKICQNDQEQVCENGAFSEPVDCKFGCHSDTISCKECETDVCLNGQFSTCSSGVLENSETCAYGCNAEGTACALCTDGMTQCAGTNRVQACDANTWLDPIDCEEGMICSNGECKETCDDGEVLCTDGVIMLCSEGKWENLMTCDTNLCKNNTECAECADDKDSCTNDTHSHKGTYSHCVSGKLYTSDCQDTQHNAVSCHNESCGGCLNGSQKCESGFAYVCENGAWSEGLFCEFGCDSDDLACNVEGECRSGETKCEDNALYLCNAGHWSRGLSCDLGCDSVGKECAKSNEAECTDGSRCVDGSKYVCQDGKWTFTQTCGYGCNLTNNDCAAPPECTDGQSECTDGVYRSCHYGSWSTSQPCANYASCANATTCGECKNDAVICTNNYAKRCVNGHWQVQAECQYGCNNTGTACVTKPPVCQNGERQCVESGNSAYMQTCANGDWNKAENCVNASCNGKECGQCLNGKTRCTNDRQETCKNAVWQFEMSCMYGCNDKNTACLQTAPKCSKSQNSCHNGNDGIGRANACHDGIWVENETCVNKSCNKDGTACGVCKDDTYNGICTANTTKICHNGAWTSYTCPYGCNDNGTGCLTTPRKCNKGATLCTNNDNGIGQYQSCVDGQWTSTKSSCNNASCNGNMCGECKNGDVSSTCSDGAIQECVNGKWTKHICSYGCNDANNGCINTPPSCSKGSTWCNESNDIGQVKTCHDGQWSATTSCGNVSCNSSGTDCGVCKNGSLNNSCNNGAIQECSNGAWTKHPCPYGCNDANNGCINTPPSCSKGSTWCTESNGIGQVKSCHDGQWGATTSCGSDSCNSSGTECGVCKDGTYNNVCSSGAIKECSNGAWKDHPCPYGCNDANNGCINTPPSCSKGATWCTDSNNIGQVKSCHDGQWGATSSCGSVSCNGTSCGACKNGALSSSCSNGAIQECQNGAWKSHPCPYGCNDANNGCINTPPSCSKGATWCTNSNNIGQVKSCHDGQWGSTTSCGSVSCNGTSCGSCKNGSLSSSCSNGAIKECSNGVWKDHQCPYGCNDANTGCINTAPSCSKGATWCSNSNNIGQVKSCHDGQWGSTTSCGTVSCNSSGTGCGACKNGTVSCFNGNVQTCKSGAWEVTQYCHYGCRKSTPTCKSTGNDNT